jgi:hypothetical protein
MARNPSGVFNLRLGTKGQQSAYDRKNRASGMLGFCYGAIFLGPPLRLKIQKGDRGRRHLLEWRDPRIHAGKAIT